MKSVKYKILVYRSIIYSNIILFGLNRYINSSNYGSSDKVKIKNELSSLSYIESIKNTETHPYLCKGMTIHTNDNSFFDNSFQLIRINAITGQEYGIYIDPMIYYDVMQWDNKFVTIPIEFAVHPNMYLKWSIKTEQDLEIFITFFYEETVSLNDLMSVKEIIHTI